MAMACSILTISCTQQEQEKKHETLTVTTEVVGLRSGEATGNYVGEIEEQNATSLSFTGSGAIKQMLVDEGQYVRKGQLIAVIDDTQARNSLAAAQAMLEQAQDGYNRLKQVHDAGSLADQQLVEMQSQLNQAIATRDMAQKSIQDCRLVSPVSGVVGKVSLRAGETALPSMTVCEVLNIESVKVKVAVPEQEITSVTASTPSTITVAAVGSGEFRGGRIEKGVTADALTRTYDVKIHVSNPGHKLLPGMVASVRLSNRGQSGQPQITLPVTAVQQNSDGSNFVWTVEGGVAKRRTVTVGQLTGNRIVIASGVSQGEKVIVKGYQKVSEGEKVKD